MKVNKYVLLGLAVIVLCTLYVTFIGGGKKKMDLAAAPPLEPPKNLASRPEVRTKEARVQAVQEKLEWERDPFTPFVPLLVEKKAEKQPVPLKLLAIMEGDRGRVAIIENEVVAKGDIVAGERVAEIGNETVTLIREGSKRVITMQEPR